MKAPGVYHIRNLVDGKVYIGSSTRCAKARISEHRYSLLHGRHPNRHLQGAWNKWGHDNFIFEIIEAVDDPTQMLAREQFHMGRTQAHDPRFGYNLAPQAGNCRGVKHGAEVRAHMSAVQRARIAANPDLLARMAEAARKGHETLRQMAKEGRHPALGYRHTEKAKASMTEKRLGRSYPGRKLSPEHIEALRKANLGHTHNLGRKHSAESRAHMSTASRGRSHQKLKGAHLDCLRLLQSAGVSYSRLGAMFGVSQATAYMAVVGQNNYDRIPSAVSRHTGKNAIGRKRKLTRIQIGCLKALRSAGVAYWRLAEFFGISTAGAYKIAADKFLYLQKVT